MFFNNVKIALFLEERVLALCVHFLTSESGSMFSCCPSKIQFAPFELYKDFSTAIEPFLAFFTLFWHFLRTKKVLF